jgi:hypothetical protein
VSCGLIFVHWAITNDSDVPTDRLLTVSIAADDNSPIAIAEAQGLSAGKAATQLNFELSSLDPSVTELKLTIDLEGVIDETSEADDSYFLTLPKMGATATPVPAPGPTTGQRAKSGLWMFHRIRYRCPGNNMKLVRRLSKHTHDSHDSIT